MSSIFDTVGTLQKSLDFHLSRHNVLSSNVANLDTPGFQPFDVVRKDGAALAGHNLAMSGDDRKHINSARSDEPLRIEAENEQVVPTGADGNSVSIDREMAKLSANGIRYDGATKMVSKKLGMLRYAANDGQGR